MPKVKDKERLLKGTREKQLPRRSNKTVNLSKENLQARRDWQEIVKVMKSRDLQPRLLYPVKLSFRIIGQIKSSSDKKKTKGIHHHQTIII